MHLRLTRRSHANNQEEPGGARRSQEEPGGARRSQEEPGGAMRTTPATRVMGITERSGQKRTTFESGGAIKKSESDQG